LHFNPERLSLPKVRQLALASGAKIASRFRHENLRIAGMDCPTCAVVLEHALGRTAGVLAVSASYAAERLQLEYDQQIIGRAALIRRIKALGYAVLATDDAAGGLAEHAELWLSGAAGLLLLAGWLAKALGWPGLSLPLWLGAYATGGFFAMRDAWQSLKHGHFDIDTLMLIAAAGAGMLGAWAEGALLLFLFSLGHALEHLALDRARHAIGALARLAPKTAWVQRNPGEVEVPVESLVHGDRVIVRPGGRIPADGTIISGCSGVNQAPITGESMPVDKRPGDRVLAGTLNGEGALTLEVTKLAHESTLARMVAMVSEAQTQKSPTQHFAERFERVFVPVVLGGVALLIVLPPLWGFPFAESFYRAMTTLVAASPCALAIATPSAVLAGIARAAREGVLIKGGAFLEHRGSMRAMAFDKTGTLTEGRFGVNGITSVEGTSEAEALALAAAVEGDSEHTIARAIRESAANRGLKLPAVHGFEAIKGRGARAHSDSHTLYVGGPRMLEMLQVQLPGVLAEFEMQASGQGQSVVHLLKSSQDGSNAQAVASFALADVIRSESRETVAKLHEMGVKVAMLTGDSQAVAKAVADQLGIDTYFAGVLPENKEAKVNELQAQGRQVAMVGDGVNDAPALTRADVGIAIGSGTDVAVESAGIILVRSNPLDIVKIISLSRASYRKMMQNLGWAAGYNVVALPLAAGILAPVGILLSPAVGAILMSLSTIIVAINAQLLRRTNI
jgi:Cd2+/Zn2+-exporting ATPase